MGTKIQFRIDEQTKRLAPQRAVERRKQLSQENWLTEQVNQAFQKLKSGQPAFTDNEQAKSRMEKFKAQLRRS